MQIKLKNEDLNKIAESKTIEYDTLKKNNEQTNETL